ncbi:septation ring formation regulator EzrA [Paenibacillus hamazuiensis]|uniref:septation ring formation regulator EzrA n=1 Tax=Paenibacillus hamazuiensis TaxID=2936508 RepID=UPI00200BCE37|nr:septation ring formation regulator EzrA [Paenibacillus hamazuiensis]
MFSQKRMLIFIFAFLLSLCLGATGFAADMPARKGYVTDPAGVFTKEDAARLEKELAAKKLKISVLTATGLSETNADALAKDAYGKWGLKADAAAMVISTKPNLVTVYYENNELKTAVEALPDDYDKDGNNKEKKLKELIDKEFVPLASKGKLADGVIAVADALGGMIKSPAPAPAAADKSSSAAKPASPSGAAAKSQQPLAAKSGGGGSKIWLFLVLILIVAVIVYAIYAFRKRAQLKTQCEQLLEQSRDVWEKVGSVLDHSLITSDLEKGFVLAKTKMMLSGIRDEAEALKAAINETSQRLRGLAIPYITFGTAQAVLAEAEEALGGYENDCERISAAFEEIVTAGKAVKESSSQANAQIMQLEAAVAEWRKKSGYPLESMTARLDQAKAKAAEAEQNDDFNVMQAKEELDEALTILSVLEADIGAMSACMSEIPELPGKIGTAKSEMESFVQKERLLLAEHNPFETLPQAKALHGQAVQLLESGYASEAAETAERVRTLLDNARTSLAAIAEQRDKNASGAAEAERKLAELLRFDARFDAEIVRLTQEYAGKHWSDLPALAADLQREAAGQAARIPQVREWNGEAVQLYSKAAAELLSIFEQIDKLEGVKQTVLGRFDTLAQKERDCQASFAEQKSRFQQAIAVLDTNDAAASGPLATLRHQVQRRLRDTDALFASRPLDLDNVQYQLQQIGAEVESFARHVDELIRQKREAEERLGELQALYRSKHSRFRSHSHLSRFSSGYDDSMSEVSRLISLGFYADALNQLSQANALLDEMEQEHDRLVREEEEARRLEQERQAEAEAAAEEERRRSADSATSSWGSDSSADSATSSWDSGSGGSGDSGSSDSGSSSSSSD